MVAHQFVYFTEMAGRSNAAVIGLTASRPEEMS